MLAVALGATGVGCANDTKPIGALHSPPPAAAAPTVAAAPEKALGTFTVTCHTGSGRTASGRPDGPGLVSVDTDVFPIGTKLRVESVGVVTAADRGAAVDGRSLDVWAASTAACTQFGRQQLQVWRPTA